MFLSFLKKTSLEGPKFMKKTPLQMYHFLYNIAPSQVMGKVVIRFQFKEKNYPKPVGIFNIVIVSGVSLIDLVMIFRQVALDVSSYQKYT